MLEVGADNGLTFANYSPAVTDVLPVEPEPYLYVLARVAAVRALGCMGQPLISAAPALDARPIARRVAPSGGLVDHAAQLGQGEAGWATPSD